MILIYCVVFSLLFVLVVRQLPFLLLLTAKLITYGIYRGRQTFLDDEAKKKGKQ